MFKIFYSLLRPTTHITISKKFLVRPLLLFGIMLLGLFPYPVRANPTTAMEAGPAERNLTLLVRFAPDVSQAERDQVVAGLGGEWVDWLPQISVAEIDISSRNGTDGVTVGNDVIAAGYRMIDLPFVYSIEVDSGIVAPHDGSVEPNSNHKPASGVESNSTAITSPPTAGAQSLYALQKIDAERAWAVTTGSPLITIAIIDSGIDLLHPEFEQRLVPGYDFVNNDTDPTDDSGHGTHVAGIAGARLDDQSDVTGVCPNCTLMPVKVLNASNSGSRAALAKGILFAVDRGARVINMSLGTFSSSPTVDAALEYAQAHDVLVVASAGNSNSSVPFYPAAHPWVIAVSATDANDHRWYGSSFGAYVEVAAPGRLIYSTYNRYDDNYAGYTYMSGTSMAAPFVAGLAGLLFSQNPRYTASEVRSLIITHVDDLGEPGFDPYVGHGRINAGRALTRELLVLPLQPVGEQDVPPLGSGGIVGSPPESVTSPKWDIRVYLPVVVQP
jgi:thermitase